MAVESLDGSVFSQGMSPNYGFNEESQNWYRLRCDSDGRLLVSTSVTTSDVFEPTTAGTTINDGASEVVTIVNTANTIIEIFDGTDLVGLVLPLSVLSAPIFVTTSLIIKSTASALTKRVAVIWRAV